MKFNLNQQAIYTSITNPNKRLKLPYPRKNLFFKQFLIKLLCSAFGLTQNPGIRYESLESLFQLKTYSKIPNPIYAAISASLFILGVVHDMLMSAYNLDEKQLSHFQKEYSSEKIAKRMTSVILNELQKRGSSTARKTLLEKEFKDFIIKSFEYSVKLQFFHSTIDSDKAHLIKRAISQEKKTQLFGDSWAHSKIAMDDILSTTNQFQEINFNSPLILLFYFRNIINFHFQDKFFVMHSELTQSDNQLINSRKDTIFQRKNGMWIMHYSAIFLKISRKLTPEEADTLKSFDIIPSRKARKIEIKDLNQLYLVGKMLPDTRRCIETKTIAQTAPESFKEFHKTVSLLLKPSHSFILLNEKNYDSAVLTYTKIIIFYHYKIMFSQSNLTGPMTKFLTVLIFSMSVFYLCLSNNFKNSFSIMIAATLLVATCKAAENFSAGYYNFKKQNVTNSLEKIKDHLQKDQLIQIKEYAVIEEKASNKDEKHIFSFMPRLSDKQESMIMRKFTKRDTGSKLEKIPDKSSTIHQENLPKYRLPKDHYFLKGNHGIFHMDEKGPVTKAYPPKKASEEIKRYLKNSRFRLLKIKPPAKRSQGTFPYKLKIPGTQGRLFLYSAGQMTLLNDQNQEAQFPFYEGAYSPRGNHK